MKGSVEHGGEQPKFMYYENKARKYVLYVASRMLGISQDPYFRIPKNSETSCPGDNLRERGVRETKLGEIVEKKKLNKKIK